MLTPAGCGRASLMRDQAMVSAYAAGSTGYSVHVDHDGAAHQMPRVLTAIMYLNSHWKPSYGGQLRLHVVSTTASSMGAHPARSRGPPRVKPLTMRCTWRWEALAHGFSKSEVGKVNGPPAVRRHASPMTVGGGGVLAQAHSSAWMWSHSTTGWCSFGPISGCHTRYCLLPRIGSR